MQGIRFIPVQQACNLLSTTKCWLDIATGEGRVVFETVGKTGLHNKLFGLTRPDRNFDRLRLNLPESHLVWVDEPRGSLDIKRASLPLLKNFSIENTIEKRQNDVPKWMMYAGYGQQGNRVSVNGKGEIMINKHLSDVNLPLVL